MDVLNLYFRFIETLSGNYSLGGGDGKMNDLEANHAMESLRKIISATNDFGAKYLPDRDLIEYGLIHELREFCDHISSTFDDPFAFFSDSGKYIKISDLFDVQVYLAITNLLWHAVAEDATWVLLNVATKTKKNQLQITIDTDMPCYNNIDTSEEVTVNLALDYIQKLGGILAIEHLTGGRGESFRLILTVAFNKWNNEEGD